MSVKLTGFKEVDAVLKGLPAQLTDKVFQKAHTRALAPFIDREKQTVPVGLTGNLRESLGVIKASGRSFGNRALGEVYAGPRRKNGFKGFAGHLNEYGTKVRATRKGANRGAMRAIPFAAPAWEQTKAQVEGLINVEIGLEVVRFMKRTIKKAG